MFFQADATRIPLKSESVDCIVTDPPFGISFDGKPSNYNREAENVYDQYRELDHKSIPLIMSELHRILKPYGSMWIVMGWNNLRYWEVAADLIGFNQIGHVIWRYQFGVFTRRRPVTSHYHLLIYTKDSKKWTWMGAHYDEDVWNIQRPYQKGGLKYPNKLPERVASMMLMRSADVGEIVYDPFTGSGTIPKAAKLWRRVGIGSDILNNKEFWNVDS